MDREREIDDRQTKREASDFKENNRNFSTAVQETRKQRSKALEFEAKLLPNCNIISNQKLLKLRTQKVSKNWPLMCVSSEKLIEDIFPQN